MEASKAESKALEAKFEDVFRDELRSLAEAIQNNSKSSDEAISTAKYVTAWSTFGFSLLISTTVKYPPSLLGYGG